MKKVAVIEDNWENLELLKLILKKYNYEVLAANSGEDGVDLVLREQPYFVIMDIDLPGIDGFEATRRIKSHEKGRSITIIAVTSFAMRGDMEKIISAGCNGYFEKPINPLTIMDEIHQIIGEKDDEDIDC